MFHLCGCMHVLLFHIRRLYYFNQFIHQSQVITKVDYGEKSTGFPVSYA